MRFSYLVAGAAALAIAAPAYAQLGAVGDAVHGAAMASAAAPATR